jgi:hypothetical protein
MSASTPVVSPIARASRKKRAEGTFVELGGEPFYCIENYDAMEEFFMSVVSASDHYLFISSNGGLTAGRKGPDNALFPYYTDDRIHDSAEHTGSKTIFRVQREDATVVWEPFSIRGENHTVADDAHKSRNLYKSVYGNRIVFEEVNHALGLAFSYEWATGDRFGFVRTAKVVNLKGNTQELEVLDGLQNLLPSGVTRRFQLEYSTLVDGYKRTELEAENGVAILQLTSVPVDRAEPSEALKANVAWAVGFERPLHLLSSVQLESFRRGDVLVEEVETHGRRGAYFVNAPILLAPHAMREWKIVADVNQDAAGVRSLLHMLRHEKDPAEKLNEDVSRGTENLLRVVAAADGLQQTREPANTWHHFASTLFNVMRGGLPDDNYQISGADFARFVRTINRQVAARHSEFLALLPEQLLHDELLRLTGLQGDVDLERISREYLPLTFSRRHGDPSRPWNIFDIRLRDEQGNRILNYQGNWRDIFQNWEALSYSYPGFTVSMIFKFLDSSTVDGYNPYRISRDGYEWEVLEPHDPWSFIGYWGDHQVVYLLRLLEQAQRCEPASLPHLLTREIFTYANVPYRIKPYADLLADSQNTIVFDQKAHKKILRNAAKLGADGKAVADASGKLAHANLAEKLLIPLLAKLSNFVPEAGIWLNTQRPEWNDANNALVGSGTSVVTLCYLRRFLHFVRDLFADSGIAEVVLSAEVAELFEAVNDTLQRNLPSADFTDEARKRILDELGQAGSKYREQLYAHGFSGKRRNVAVASLKEFFDTTLRHVDHSIKFNRRDDGLYHAYNLMESTADGIRVHNLALMLEGQVAALSSGALSSGEAVELLGALRNSPLYRADQHSYMLYPIKTQSSFLDQNNLPAESVAKSRLLAEMIAKGDRRIVVRDLDGGVHFHGSFQNVSLLRSALEGVKERRLGKRAKQEAGLICEIYEEVFQHRFFTGRSETLYKYEGIGCIYWHMVSKLLVAAREALTQAVEGGADEALLQRLREQYNDIRAGLGTHKTPAEYGAVPMDPYSHTPGFAGAQQPGMTGQVKEDFIARMGELGVQVRGGEIHFVPQLMTGNEFLDGPSAFHYWDVGGEEHTLQLDAGMLAFTYCQVLVVVHREGQGEVRVSRSDGGMQVFKGCGLDRTLSKTIFQRTGDIRRLDVFFDSSVSNGRAREPERGAL